MLNSGMIPTGNSDIPHTFILGKTRPGEEIQILEEQQLGQLLQTVLQGCRNNVTHL